MAAEATFALVALVPKDSEPFAASGVSRESRRFPMTAAAQLPQCGSAPGRTRTCDPRLRRPVLYPPELRAPDDANS